MGALLGALLGPVLGPLWGRFEASEAELVSCDRRASVEPTFAAHWAIFGHRKLAEFPSPGRKARNECAIRFWRERLEFDSTLTPPKQTNPTQAIMHSTHTLTQRSRRRAKRDIRAAGSKKIRNQSSSRIRIRIRVEAIIFGRIKNRRVSTKTARLLLCSQHRQSHSSSPKFDPNLMARASVCGVARLFVRVSGARRPTVQWARLSGEFAALRLSRARTHLIAMALNSRPRLELI